MLPLARRSLPLLFAGLLAGVACISEAQERSGVGKSRYKIGLDRDGNVYLVGETASNDFPTTPGVFQPARKGVRDAAIVKLQPDGSGLVFSTLLGGGDSEGLMGVRVAGTTQWSAGNVYVAGHTQSADFPVTPGAPQAKHGGQSDCYLAKLNGDASRLLYATYLGGSGGDLIRSVALGPRGEIYLVGNTSSSDFPVTPGAVQTKLRGGTDAVIVKLVPNR